VGQALRARGGLGVSLPFGCGRRQRSSIPGIGFLQEPSSAFDTDSDPDFDFDGAVAHGAEGCLSAMALAKAEGLRGGVAGRGELGPPVWELGARSWELGDRRFAREGGLGVDTDGHGLAVAACGAVSQGEGREAFPLNPDS
jgi:hypothetical protein